MRTIAVFGATGNTGLCAVQAALKKGIKVKAFVRDESKLPEELKDKVEVVLGDVLNYDDVLKGVSGVDAVTVVLGTRNDLSATTVLSEGMKNIIKAMKASNLDVVSVCLSAFLFYELEKVPAIFKDLNADHQRMLDVVKASDLKYIAILPPHIADQPESEYKVSHGSSPGRVVSKYDLGKFLVECLTNPEHYGKVCGITSATSSQ